MLAPQEGGGLSGQTAENNVGGVDDVPLTLDVAGLGAERTHGRSLRFFSEWGLPGSARTEGTGPDKATRTITTALAAPR
ncbi:hypothetical protein GCM10017744_046650 [Streptomyces antimycoticus]|uniref:Uncharacterized protein n=3 Tax=Streptomyces TaxID=1883 RepID=A0A4D4K6F4_9ACTN|nr:hypothetical protein SSPO_044670 [Streptomyces antimycoticus]GDY44691.1 hypothetical protein SANT12839_055730 [Streptomyces antimycoticus]